MTLTKLQITNGIKKATGTDDSDWDAGDLDLYANKSWWKIMDEFDFREKESSITFPTVLGTLSYSLPNAVSPNIFDAIQTISLEDESTGVIKELLIISLQDYENQYVIATNNYAAPEKYFRRGNSIVLWPTPDKEYTVRIYYLQVLSDIPTNGPVIPQAWHEAIQYGANYRAFADMGDVVKTQFWKSMYKDEINNLTPVKVKELADTKMSGIEVPGRDYP